MRVPAFPVVAAVSGSAVLPSIPPKMARKLRKKGPKQLPTCLPQRLTPLTNMALTCGNHHLNRVIFAVGGHLSAHLRRWLQTSLLHSIATDKHERACARAIISKQGELVGMNKKMKRRLAVVSGVIVIVLILVLAVVSGGNGAKSVTVAELSSSSHENQKVQVSGTVVDNSFSTSGGKLSFDISDPDNVSAAAVHVVYDKGVSSTFGNGVTAICTGKIDSEGVLQCMELVTKCPSKYENASDALGVDELIAYGSKIEGKTVKVAGVIKAGSLGDVSSQPRMVIADEGGSQELAIVYDGALADAIFEGTTVVVTGSLQDDGSFVATDVAQQA